MKFAYQLVTLPKDVVDAYLDALLMTTDPILKEEDVPATVVQDLLYAASAACCKSVIIKHLKSIEEAGLFKGVHCIESPDFKWTLGLKRLYAISVFQPNFVKTLAVDISEGRRNGEDYLNYLDTRHRVELEAGVHSALKDAPEAVQRRLEDAMLTITQANLKYMLGGTSENTIRLLRNVKDNLEMQVDGGPLVNLEDDLSLIIPELIFEM